MRGRGAPARFRTSKPRGRKRRRPEEEFQAEIIKVAELFGWRHHHHRISIGSSPGFPDLILVKVPRLIAAECKADDNTTTDDQRVWLLDLERCGAESVVWRPVEATGPEVWPIVETIDAILERLKGEGALKVTK